MKNKHSYTLISMKGIIAKDFITVLDRDNLAPQ